MASKIKPAGKFAIFLLVGIAVLSGLYFTGNLTTDSIAPSKSNSADNSSRTNTDGDVKTFTVAVVDWGGYVGGQYWNKGFQASTNSNFYRDYGFMVEFKVMNDFDASRAAWKAGNVDLLWATTGSFSTEAVGIKDEQPQIIFQADWSRGGDAVVVRRGINSVSDLKGKTIAVAPMTPSHTFFLNLLEAGNIAQTDVSVIEVASAIDAAAMFKNEQCDAAIVWSPDDITCVQTVRGSKVLQSTKQASNIIADVFIAKKSTVDKYGKELTQLVEGWLKGAAEINNSEVAKAEAAEILAAGINCSKDVALKSIENVRLTTYGDNLNYFGLNSSFRGVTGEKIYTEMTAKYKQVGYIKPNQSTNWREVANYSIINGIRLVGAEHDAEGTAKFTAPTATLANTTKTQAVSTKKVTVSFPNGSSTLSEDSKYKIDKEFVDIAKTFANSRIRIIGNTDATGSDKVNVPLSKKRAQAVANYLANEYGFDPNRFVVVGNGSKNAKADGITGSNAYYRKTDFELIAE